MDQAVADKVRPAGTVPRRRLIFAASLMATFMAAVESTIVATAMPTIVADLGGFRLFSWVFAAYLLTMAVSIPVYGRLADLYGRKRIFFVGAGIFLVGSTLCGFARSMVMLVLFRALQGAGAGAVQPLASTIVGDIFTPTERARAQGWISSVFGVSAIIGPALGAFLVTHLHWSVVFWVNLPIGFVAITMFALFLHERVEPRPHRMDYLGGVLMVIGVGALMLALVEAASLDIAHILLLVAIAAAALALLFVHERQAAEPMVPLGLWRRRVIALSNLGVCGTGATMMGVTVLLPTFVQGAMGGSPGIAGMVLGAMSVSWMFASIGAGRLMIRTSYRRTAVLGGAALVGGSIMLLTLDPKAGVWWPLCGSLLIGVGMGSCNTSFLVAIQASVDWSERAVATSSNMFMRMIGQSLGATIFGAILNFGLQARLPGASDAVNRLLEPGARRILDAGDIARLADAVARSAHDAYFVVVLVAAATLAVGAGFPAGLSPSRPAR
ncbi:MAG TPA: MDR family MFS transporter [Stellaceae bacterium]|nr:MDR family MFS transporter [Stellaceae bacterium]